MNIDWKKVREFALAVLVKVVIPLLSGAAGAYGAAGPAVKAHLAAQK